MDKNANYNENALELNDESLTQVPKGKKEKFSQFMIDTLKEMYQCLRYPKFKFSISGIIVTVILTLISIGFFILPFFLGDGSGIQLAVFKIPPNLFGIPISIIIAFLVIYLWFLIGIKITPKAAHYLMDNPVLKVLFTRGDVHYLEYIPEEKRKIALPHILNKFIALLIAWVSLSAFLINLIAGGDPISVIRSSDILPFILRSIILFILVPLIFILIYPLGWMLMDAKLKAFHSGTKLNWLVGRKITNLTGGFITLGCLVALGADAINRFDVRAQLIIDLIIFCVINVSLIVILVSLFYNVFFQGKFYQIIIDSIDVDFAVTSVTFIEETYEKPKPEVESQIDSEINQSSGLQE